MKILVRVLKIVGLVIVLLVVIAVAAGYWFISMSHPQTSGTMQVPGLKSRVQVLRDPYGVPHIYADTSDDLFFAQGYVTAQDRLWQMEFNRHIGHGQLSELFGADQIKADQYLRTIGLARAARADVQALDTESRTYLQKYADGVNAFIHSHQDNLPVEFTLISDHPSDWQPVDSLVWGKVMARSLGGNYERELLRAALSQTLGAQSVSQLVPPFPPSGPFVIPPEVKNYASLYPHPNPTPVEQGRDIGQPDLAALAQLDESLQMMPAGIGSNDWVVDGTRTTTGKPLLANDPHLGISMPAVWYTNGLHCNKLSEACPFDLVGYTFPGVPGVVIGHNNRIAWGVTNVNPDVQDLFLEKINPANPNQYEYQGQWMDMELDRQVIHVKGGADVPLTVQYTRHGPIMTPVLKGVTATLALQWTATHERGTIFEALLRLDRAQNWDDFRNALKQWDAPSQNFVYADVDGNIGYQMPGRIPIRAQGDGTLPVPGWTGEYEWKGYIPLAELPFVYNPPSHFIVTANNQVVPNDYKYLITRDWDPPFRAMRINELIRAQAKLSEEDFKTIQGDVYSLPLTKLQKYLAPLTPQGFLGERAMKYVKDWDGALTRDTIGGAILEVTYVRLVRDMFSNRLGAGPFQSFMADGDNHHLLMYGLLDDSNNPWWDDPSTPQRETRDDRLRAAYFEGVDWLGSQFGDWPPDWHWGRIHTATFAHPFGARGPLDVLFNSGPFPMQGDGYTVFNTGFDDNDPYTEQIVPSMREIIDLSNLDNSQWIQTTGESGQPLSGHYTDLTALWRDVKYAPLYFSRAAVEGVRSEDLILSP